MRQSLLGLSGGPIANWKSIIYEVSGFEYLLYSDTNAINIDPNQMQGLVSSDLDREHI